MVWQPIPCRLLLWFKDFKDRLKSVLGLSEKVNADIGYNDEKALTPCHNHAYKYLFDWLHAHHETFNDRMKIFKILTPHFRLNLERHSSLFQAICNILYLMLKEDNPLFI